MILHEAQRSGQKQYFYHQFDENLCFPKHTHVSFEVVFCLEGRLFCDVGGKTYVLTAGKGLLILPGYIHSYQTPEKSRSYLCVFSTDLVDSFYEVVKGNSLSDVCFTFEDRGDIDRLTDPERSVFVKQAVLYALCGRVYEQSRLSAVDASYFALTNSLSLYVQNNYVRPIRLKEIAAEFGYDYSYLSSFFNKNFGTDFTTFVNRYRVQHACRLLRSTGDSITAIALQSGFSTIRNFNRAFREETGMTPREYRMGK